MALGWIDVLDHYQVSGWALEADGKTPDRVAIDIDGEEIAIVRPTLFRPDLREAGLGDGRAGFRFCFPEPIGLDRPARVVVRALSCGEILPQRVGEEMRREGNTVGPDPQAPIAPHVPATPAAPLPSAQPARAALMARFCHLGESGEFGLVQHRCGADPADLLRWTTTPLPVLIALLGQRFAGLGDPACLEVSADPSGDYVVRHARYDFSWPAFVREGEMTAEEVARRERARLPLQADRLIEDLREGGRIFVRTEGAPEAARIEALVAALRAYGRAPLLLVTPADPAHPCGAVESAGDGLLRGYLAEGAAGAEALAARADRWLRLCENAVRLIEGGPNPAPAEGTAA